MNAAFWELTRGLSILKKGHSCSTTRG